MTDSVKAKVATDKYSTENEAPNDVAKVLPARARMLEVWLREHVAPAFDAIKADPARAVGGENIRARLAAEHKAAKQENPE